MPHRVGQALDVVQRVRGEEHGLPALADRSQHAFEELLAGDWVEAGHRLVEQQHLGVVRHGQKQRELHPRPLRQVFHLLAGIEGEQVEHLPAGVVVPRLVQRPAEADRLFDAHPAVYVVILRHVADPLLHRHGLGQRVEPEHAGLAGRGRKHAHEHLDRGALARAVRADQAEGGPAVDLEREIIDGRGAAEPLGQADQLDGRAAVCWGGHYRGSSAWATPSMAVSNTSRICPAFMPAARPVRIPSSKARRTVCRGVGLGRRGPLLGDEEALASSRVDQPFAFQLVVRPLDGVGVHLDIDGQGPERGQGLAGAIDFRRRWPRGPPRRFAGRWARGFVG